MTHNEQIGQAPEADDNNDPMLALLLGELSEAEDLTAIASLSKPDAREFSQDIDALAALGEEMARARPAPRKALKERILSAAAAATEEPTPNIVRQAESEWVTDPKLPGIRMKILNRDAATGVLTALAQLDPGTTYPAHRHVGPETCYVISGDLHVNSTDLESGDFIANPDGAVHQRTYTVGGCLLLLASSFQDQFLSENS